MSLDDLRNRIDEVDAQLVKLLNECARVVVEVGKLKSRTDGPIYAPIGKSRCLRRSARRMKDLCPTAPW